MRWFEALGLVLLMAQIGAMVVLILFVLWLAEQNALCLCCGAFS